MPWCSSETCYDILFRSGGEHLRLQSGCSGNVVNGRTQSAEHCHYKGLNSSRQRRHHNEPGTERVQPRPLIGAPLT